jgi:Flp pilus assembly protein CpaB
MIVLNAATSGGNVTLEATPTQAGQLIYASSNDQIWLVLRPTIGTTPKSPVISASQVTGG